MKNSSAEELFQKYRRGETTPEENAIIESWYISEGLNAPSADEDIAYKAKEAQLWAKIQAQRRPIIRSTNRPWPRLAAAAVVLLALSLGIYFYLANHTGPNNEQSASSRTRPITNNDIDPGGNKAILTLDDGRKITLDDAANGELAEESGIKITKTEDGQIVYEAERLETKDQSEADPDYNLKLTTYNTIKTPKGGQYKIILPDSSVVWLNAASSLRYPTRFEGTERRVELTGEAYFQVNKVKAERLETKAGLSVADAGKSPTTNIQQSTSNRTRPATKFIVATATQEVTVLGTQFNINAYADEAVVKTTLLEGSVQVVNIKSKTVNTLLPGEQSILQGNSLTKQYVDPREAVAWKDGLFHFDDETLESIMRKVSRWYDIKVVFEDESLKAERVVGIITRYSKVSAVLDMLAKAGDIRYEINNREVKIKK